MTAANDKYPKSFVLQRVQTRLDVLRSDIAQGEEAVARHLAEREPVLKEFLEKQIVQTDEKRDLLRKLALDWPDLPVIEQQKRLSEVTGRGHQYAPQLYSDRSIGDLGSKLDRLRHEVSELEQLKAYIDESPIEVYSVTSLRQLGAIDVMKFSLRH